MTTTNRVPQGSAAGKKLWLAVTAEYELTAHEAAAPERCQTADLVADCRPGIDEDGPVLPTGKNHPAVAEIRQQRITLARLLVALQVPAGDGEGGPAAAAGFCAGFTSSVTGMRRSLPEQTGCCRRVDRFAAVAVVSAWAAAAAAVLLLVGEAAVRVPEAGNEWPGGEGRELTDCWRCSAGFRAGSRSTGR